MSDFDLWQPQRPLPVPAAVRSVASCAASTAPLLWHDRILWPHSRVGTILHFADGTSGRIFRETVIPKRRVDPCLLVVTFRLVLLRGAAHLAFERESILNTPLFVGFPGFRSKLWVAADERGRYRGIYDWDGALRAAAYARSLWRVLALGSFPDSIAYRVVPEVTVSELLQGRVSVSDPEREGWWVPVGRPVPRLELAG
jgi:hypothetical protein